MRQTRPEELKELRDIVVKKIASKDEKNTYIIKSSLVCHIFGLWFLLRKESCFRRWQVSQFHHSPVNQTTTADYLPDFVFRS
jgi:hypothetical protein